MPENKYKIYEIYPHQNYIGYSLVAANNENEAKKIIKNFQKFDENNIYDSLGYDTLIEESDVIKHLFSDKKGIIYYGIHYDE